MGLKYTDEERVRKRKEVTKRYRNNNRDKLRECGREYSRKYKFHYRNVKKFREQNIEKVRLWNRKTSILRKRATPKWLTEEHIKLINEFYVLAKELDWLSEDKLVVDHIVPIKGKNVCGLHVPWNLQILPMRENSRKGNRG